MTINFLAELRRLVDILRKHGQPAQPGRASTSAAVHKVARSTGIEFTDAVAALYTQRDIRLQDLQACVRVDGELRAVSFMSLREAQDYWRVGASSDDDGVRLYRSLYPKSNRRDRRIRPELLNHRRWFPLALDGCGSTLYYDADPAARGRVGQIIFYRHDPDEMFYVAADLASFFKQSNDRFGKPGIAREMWDHDQEDRAFDALAAREKQEAADARSRIGSDSEALRALRPRAALAATATPFATTPTLTEMRRLLDELRVLTAVLYRDSPYHVGYTAHAVAEVPIVAKPAAAAKLERVEQALSRKLPATYRMFLTCADGVERFDRTFALSSTAALVGNRYAKIRKRAAANHPNFSGLVIGASEYTLPLLTIMDDDTVEYRDGDSPKPRRYASLWKFLRAHHAALRDALAARK